MVRLILLAGFVLSASCSAQSNPTKLELAEQLTKLLHFDKLFDAYLADCARPEGPRDAAAAAYEASHESFGGISPNSAYWPEIEAIYSRYRRKTCEYVSTEKFTNYFVEQFAEHASDDDLRAAVAFYSTPAGKRIQSMAYEANVAFNDYAAQLRRKYEGGAQVEFQRDLLALEKKFQEAPK